MVRIIGILFGALMVLVVMASFIPDTWKGLTDPPPVTAEKVFFKPPKEVAFSFDGPLGNWDTQQLQRGYKVYKDVCSSCHGLKFVAFRNLGELGYTEAEVQALAAEWIVPGVDPDTGETITRPGTPTDQFPSPYPNNIAAAAANNNAIPPDLSLITKARKQGTDYLYSLLVGYEDPPQRLIDEFPDAQPGPGLHYNPYFKNLNIAMANPIAADGLVTYDDGTEATKEQMAWDVAAFLTWTAEPRLVQRKQTGWAVLGFLLIATVFAWLSYQQIWSSVKPKNGVGGSGGSGASLTSGKGLGGLVRLRRKKNPHGIL